MSRIFTRTLSPTMFDHPRKPPLPVPSWLDDEVNDRYDFFLDTQHGDLRKRYEELILSHPEKVADTLRQLWRDRKPGAINYGLLALTTELATFKFKSVKSESFEVNEDAAAGVSIIDVSPHVALWKSMILTGLLGIYQEILNDSKILDEFPLWMGHLLRGFSVLVRICHLAPFTNSQNNLFIASLLNFGPVLFDHFWTVRKLLVNDIPRLEELFSDVRRGIGSVILAYVDLCNDRECMPSLREWKALHLAMFCWFHMPEQEPEIDLQKLFMDTMHLSCQAGTQYEVLDEFVRTVVVPEFGAEKFLQRINRDLNNPDIVYARIMPLLVSACSWMRNKIFGPLFNKVGTYEAVAEAWSRQEQLESDPEDQWFLLRDVIPFLGFCCAFLPISEGAGPWIKEHGVVKIMSQALLICARAGGMNSHEHLLELITAYCTVALSAEGRRGRNTLYKTLQSATRAEWYPALKELEVVRYRLGDPEWLRQLTRMWMELGLRVGLVESVEQERYEKEKKDRTQFCSWKQCQFHTEKPTRSLRTCVGCSEARYCDRACQAKDWKQGGHKAICRRLKAGAA